MKNSNNLIEIALIDTGKSVFVSAYISINKEITLSRPVEIHYENSPMEIRERISAIITSIRDNKDAIFENK